LLALLDNFRPRVFQRRLRITDLLPEAAQGPGLAQQPFPLQPRVRILRILPQRRHVQGLRGALVGLQRRALLFQFGQAVLQLGPLGLESLNRLGRVLPAFFRRGRGGLGVALRRFDLLLQLGNFRIPRRDLGGQFLAHCRDLLRQFLLAQLKLEFQLVLGRLQFDRLGLELLEILAQHLVLVLRLILRLVARGGLDAGLFQFLLPMRGLLPGRLNLFGQLFRQGRSLLDGLFQGARGGVQLLLKL
jgi:hypothetical protein